MSSSTAARLSPALIRGTAIAAAVLLLTILTVSRSRAAFSASATNAGSTFSTGSVVLTDDDTGTALFTASGMSPGPATQECIELTYSGSTVPAPVRLYGTTSGALAPYLDVVIDVGTGGSFGNCAGFTSSGNVFTGTLQAFGTTHSNWTSGAAVFTAASNPTVRTVRFSVTVQNTPAAQAKSANADFVFETQA